MVTDAHIGDFCVLQLLPHGADVSLNVLLL
jgi:hypothetical protein